MSAATGLVLSSILFAVLWTAFMIWWTGTETANIVAMSIAGIVAGVAWYFGMRWFNRRLLRPPSN